jgi:hypothetical protein
MQALERDSAGDVVWVACACTELSGAAAEKIAVRIFPRKKFRRLTRAALMADLR